jgi:hypothetical protein
MPGGGTVISTGADGPTLMNNGGDVVFSAALSSHFNNNVTADTGLFVWSKGSLRLVARTGTVFPGIGTLDQLVMGVMFIPPPPVVLPSPIATGNDHGQIVFGATLTGGRGVLLLATPKH